MVEIVTRNYSEVVAHGLERQGCHPVLSRVLAARGIRSASQLDCALTGLIAPELLTNVARMAGLLADAIAQQKKLLVVADYDADGATACAVAVSGLRRFGARVEYLVPNRFEYGYGLTPEIVQLAAKTAPDFIITVDNGIASVEGVAAANALGITVLVTDHHLPGDVLPQAGCIINPNQRGCEFPSKNLAGVGVVFYLVMALRAELRQRGAYEGAAEPGLTDLLDLVALGTVADLVRLDDNNRILVEQGLRRMRAGKARPGIMALLKVAGRECSRVTAQDLGFSVGPRLNAAGRLEDMALGIECLLAEDPVLAEAMAQRLDALNRERRSIEAEMHESALSDLEQVDPGDRYSLALYQQDWHQGVIGILASRLKERFHRPVIAFAPAGDATIKGSGRSIAGLHLRDALDLLSKQHPGMLLRFGGHAMAAGLAIREVDFQAFSEAFERVVRGCLSSADLNCVIETDGSLSAAEVDLVLAETLDHQVWGQGFAAPEFCDQFVVRTRRVVGERHLKLVLRLGGRDFDAILFNCNAELPERIRAVYRPQVNEYKGTRGLQLQLRCWEPV